MMFGGGAGRQEEELFGLDDPAGEASWVEQAEWSERQEELGLPGYWGGSLVEEDGEGYEEREGGRPDFDGERLSEEEERALGEGLESGAHEVEHRDAEVQEAARGDAFPSQQGTVSIFAAPERMRFEGGDIGGRPRRAGAGGFGGRADLPVARDAPAIQRPLGGVPYGDADAAPSRRDQAGGQKREPADRPLLPVKRYMGSDGRPLVGAALQAAMSRDERLSAEAQAMQARTGEKDLGKAEAAALALIQAESGKKDNELFGVREPPARDVTPGRRQANAVFQGKGLAGLADQGAGRALFDAMGPRGDGFGARPDGKGNASKRARPAGDTAPRRPDPRGFGGDVPGNAGKGQAPRELTPDRRAIPGGPAYRPRGPPAPIHLGNLGAGGGHVDRGPQYPPGPGPCAGGCYGPSFAGQHFGPGVCRPPGAHQHFGPYQGGQVGQAAQHPALAGAQGGGDGLWHASASDYYAVDRTSLEPGTILEVATYESYGKMDGTALFIVQAAWPCDNTGMLVAAIAAGASVPAKQVEFEMNFPVPSGPGINPNAAYLHLCRTAIAECLCDMQGWPCLHADLWRTRNPNTISEPWAQKHRFSLIRNAMAGTAALPPGAAKPAGSDPEKAALKDQVDKLESAVIKAKGSEAAVKLVEAAKKKAARDRAELFGDDTETSLFQEAPLEDFGSSHKKLPDGVAFQRGVEEVNRFLGARGGAENNSVTTSEAEGRFMTYLYSVFQAAHGASKIGPRNLSELRCLAEAMDQLRAGDLAKVSDILLCRFKAIEASVTEGSWEMAKHIDLTASTRVALASTPELLAAQKSHLLMLKLQDAKKRLEKDKGDGS